MQARAADSARGTAHSRGYTSAWQRYSLVFRAEHPLCYYCQLQGIVEATACVDHATPPSRGGSFWDPRNHRGACIACNSAKGDRTEAEFLGALRVAGRA